MRTRLRTLMPALLRIVLGAILVAASVDKIAHPTAFAEAVHNYGILPGSLVSLVAVVLPWLELFCGMGLIVNRLARGAALISVTLMVVFLAALGFNMARGLDVACGCFSTSGTSAADWTTLLRDGVFLLLAMRVFAQTLGTDGADTDSDTADAPQDQDQPQP